jgi:hypothetical protein
MRRSLFLYALLVALVSAVCWAQRGGGYTGGGRVAGGFGPHGGMRSFGGAHFSGQHHGGFHGSGFGHAPHHGPVIVTHGRFGGHHFANRRSYPYYPFYSWYGYSYWPSWDYGDAEYDARFGNNYDSRYQAAAELNRLANEVEQLKEDRDYAQAVAAMAPAPASQPTVQARAQEDLPVVVVFLDKRIREVKNYAVANEMLVVLDGSKRTKIPLADIDLAATMKLNDERGVDFQVPNPVMRQ